MSPARRADATKVARGADPPGTGIRPEAYARNSPKSGAASPELLRGWIASNGRRFADKAFVHSIDQHKAITYGQLYELTNQLAAFLSRNGIRANDRIALLSNNSIEHLASYVGVMAYGATICTINVEMNSAHLDEILNGLRPRLVFCEDGLGVEHFAGGTPGEWIALGDWQPDGGTGLFAALPDADGGEFVGRGHDDACICFTSGTGSKPKGVVLSFGELLANVEPTADAFAMTSADRVLDYRSYNWASAQILSGLAPLCKGATVAMARKFSRSRFFHWIKEYGATIAAGNPTTINMLMSESDEITAADVPTLRFMTSSSAPLLVEEWQRFEDRFGIAIAQGYGSSEAGWIAGSNEQTRRLGSAGRPLPYHDLGIVDREGNALPPGEIGFVELGNDPDREYRYLAGDGSIRVGAKGRYRTGDLGRLDEQGWLYLTGREKDLIIRGGVNIAPVEIDGVLLQHPNVAEAATVGVPDRIYGEEVVSYVVVKHGARLTEDALLAHCLEQLSPFKAPKRIVFRTDLPKTGRGKMDRKALIEEWKRAEASSA